MSQNNVDPLLVGLQKEKRKSVSWKYTREGATRVFRVQGPADQAQRTVYGTSDLAFWDLKTGQSEPDPKMAVVFQVFDEEEQEDRTLWLPIPSALLTAVAEAQQAAFGGSRSLTDGDTLEITFIGTKPSGKGEPQKLYSARVTAGPGPVKPDPLAAAAAPSTASVPSVSRTIPSDEPPF